MKTAFMTCGLVFALTLSGCGGGGGGGGVPLTDIDTGTGGDPANTTVSNSSVSELTISSVLLRGTTSEDAAVTVAGINDEDGTIDQTWVVTLSLDDNELPADPGLGSGSTNTVSIIATDNAGNADSPSLQYDVDLLP